MKTSSLSKPRALLLTLLLSALCAQAVEFTPGELILKLRRPPLRNSLDQVASTSAASLNTYLAASNSLLAEPLAAFRERLPETDGIVMLSGVSASSLDSLLSAFASDPQVEWVTRNYRYRTVSDPLDYIPNDTLFSDAWWLEKISAPLAWDITRGDSSLVMGIIDTGVDYLHPDLVGNIWHNWADADSDGVDDDNNGFIDDFIGWDFVDAPTFPAGGDYLERDNDPLDEHGHGTYIAGIACATSDNETCFPSIGYKCRVMPLRAGNIDGLLEEDDIAAALLYGATNGANVINMSFGDVVASPLLREAVRLAAAQGAILVASAGNNFTDTIHYPSGFPEVISVGATDQIDRKADFSNFGPSVDVMAPGVAILSTIIGGDCGAWTYPDGTSYAAPMVGAAALLALSLNSALTPQDVLDLVKSTADDIGEPGWDPQTVNGRLNVRRVIEQASGSDVVARITSPINDAGVTESFTLFGEAWGAAFESYQVSWGLGENPAEWHVAGEGTERQYGEPLAVIPVPDVDTVLIARLEVSGLQGVYSVDNVHLFVQRSAPSIDSMTVTRMLDENSYAELVHVWTNQYSSASMLLTNSTGDSVREDFGYVAQEHVGLLNREKYPGAWQVRVRLENLAGQSALSEPFDYEIVTPPIGSHLFVNEPTNLPAGLLGDFATDYDCDELSEIWHMSVSPNGALDTLQPAEFAGADFIDTGNRYGVHIPQATGDADGDGLREMMARRFSETRVWEQSTACVVFNSVVYESVGDFSEFLGAAFYDLDDNDSGEELVARVGLAGAGSRYAVFGVDADYALTLIDTLPNNSAGSNNLGPPKLVIDDLDHDGLPDFLFGDYDGDLIFCEYENGMIEQRWETRLPLNDATIWFASGDFDGDGETEFVAGCRSNSSGGTESQRRSRHWEYFIFEATGDNEFTIVDSLFILGNENVRDYPASITTGDVDADDRDEILISAFPDFYVIGYDDASESYTPRWYSFPAQANAILVKDLDEDGINEFYYSDGTRIRRVEAASASGERPPAPVDLTGEPTGPSSVQFSWRAVPGADTYVIYFSFFPDGDYALLSENSDTTVAMQGLAAQTHWFRVSTIDSTYPQIESVLSSALALTPNEPPTVEETAEYIEPHFVKLRFSEPMGESAFVQGNFRLDDARMPAVIIAEEAGRVLTLSFDGEFPERDYSLELRNLRDAQLSRLPQSTVTFTVARDTTIPPRILTHSLTDPAYATQVDVVYSEPMEQLSVLDPLHYLLDYGRAGAPSHAVDVTPLREDNREVRVSLPPDYPVGALGLSVRMLIRDVTNLDGIALDTTSGQADLLLTGEVSGLSHAYVFPNPYRGIGAGGGAGVHFAGLPENAQIRIFTIQGILIRELEHHNRNGAAAWDLRTDDGSEVASGIYIYVIESGSDEERGKLAVMR